MGRYNLVDEQWIPVRDLAGNLKELGILETLTSAEELASIEDPSPLVTAALHRFLLAVLYRALDGPCDIDDAKKLFRDGFPKEKIRTYLDKWKNRFWLFDERYPFGQIAEYEPTIKHGKQIWRAWTALAAEHNADNAKMLFDHVGVEMAGTIPAKQAIKWLLSCQTFALGGGKSDFQYVKDAPSATSMMTIPMGSNLFDTLVFCLVPQNREVMKNDYPIWERDPENIEELRKGIDRLVMGFCDLFTWQSRSIHLKGTEDDSVGEIAFASGIGVWGADSRDPLVGFHIDEKKGKLPVQFRERGFWRDFDSLLPDESRLSPAVIDNSLLLSRNESNRFPQSVIVLGQKNNKAKIEFWRMERFVLPQALKGDRCIRHDIHKYLKEAEDGGRSLRSACNRFSQHLLSRGERLPDPKDVRNFVEQLPALPHYWSALEARFHEVLRDYTLDRNPEDVEGAWLIAVRNALSNAWGLLWRSISGSDAWSIRAMAKADGNVALKIIELNKKIRILKEVP